MGLMFVCTMEEAECPMPVYIFEFDIRVLSCLFEISINQTIQISFWVIVEDEPVGLCHFVYFFVFNAFYSRMFICLAVRSEVMPLNCLVTDGFTLSHWQLHLAICSKHVLLLYGNYPKLRHVILALVIQRRFDTRLSMLNGHVVTKSGRWVSIGYFGCLPHEDHTNSNISANEHDLYKLYGPVKSLKNK